MDSNQAKQIFHQALAKTLKRQNVDWSPDSDLLKDETLDSLDCVVFTLQLQDLARIDLPQDQLSEPDFFRANNLIKLLTKA